MIDLYLYLPLYQAFLAFTLFILVTQFMHYRWSYSYCNNPSIPRYTIEDCEQRLQHGDVLNNNYFKNGDRTNFLKFQWFNYRLSHLVIVIEEEGKKYILESVSGNNFDPKRCIGYWDSPNRKRSRWYITKQPLHEYLLVNYCQVIRVLRHPRGKDMMIPKGSLNSFQPNVGIVYCTMFVGKMLAVNGYIKECHRLFSYRTTPFIEQMMSNGFRDSFFFIVQ